MSKIFKTIWYYEWVTFRRNRTQVVLFATVFLFGIYAIFCGRAYMEGQRQTIAQLMDKETAEFEGYMGSFQEELVSKESKQLHNLASKPAFAWFRHGYHVISPPHDYANLAIGQRDLHRYYYRLTGMSLYYQLYENEIAHPYYLLVGNLDLSFIIIYILPLLIIVFCYSIYSGEKDAGILPLLRIQRVSIKKILLVRLLFYFFLIVSLALLLSLIGFLVSGNLLKSYNWQAAITWSVAVAVYCIFWFGLLFFIISFRKNTSFNAISSIGAWVFILIIIPAILTIALDHTYPLNNTALAELTRRTGLDDENDEVASKKVISEFLEHKPEFAQDTLASTQNLMAKAYAAFIFLKDIDSKKLIDRHTEVIQMRSQRTASLGWLNPSVTVQETLSRVAGTDLDNHLAFQKALSEFHTQITDFYFERLFLDKDIALQDYSKRPQFKPQNRKTDWVSVYIDILLVAFVACIFFFQGLLILKKTK